MSAAEPADRPCMEQALALAALGEGTASPNPRVGCVVVRDGRVVGHGWHRAPGQPHAETLALDRAGERARGATLYVNLEPCAHHGRTPPCTDRIVAAGIRRVVAAITDPNPLVDGRGFRALRAAGIAVVTGVLADEAARLNRAFLHWHATGRPWVTLKAAVSGDGMLAARHDRSRWITSQAARRFAHRLRHAHDAVLVGAGTVRRDDPRLTTRLGDRETAAARVVLARRLDLDPGAAVLIEAPGGPRTRVYVPRGTADPAGLDRVADVREVAAGPEGVDLDAVLADLGRDAIQSVLVEGGGLTHATFLRAGRADGLALFSGAVLLGARGGTPMIDAPAVDEPGAGWRILEPRRIPLGDDLVTLARIARGEAACSPE